MSKDPRRLTLAGVTMFITFYEELVDLSSDDAGLKQTIQDLGADTARQLQRLLQSELWEYGQLQEVHRLVEQLARII